MLVCDPESVQLPINSVAVVASASNHEVSTIVRNLLHHQGISTCLQVELPVCKPVKSIFWRSFIMGIDRLLSKLLAGSKVPSFNEKLPNCPLRTLEDFQI